MRVTTAKINTFKANKQDKTETGEYKDPLMRWPLRAASFTNSAGEVLRPLIGSYATLGWAPVLMYIGADIYDKYKNNENEYSPSSKRFLTQAIYQGISTLLLPILTSKIGQDVFSLFGKISKSKLNFNTQEKISKIAETFVANGKMQEMNIKRDETINEFMNIVYNNLDFNRQESSAKNPIKKVIDKFEKWAFKLLKIDPKKRIESHAKRTIEELADIREKILNPTEEFKSTKVYKDFLAGLNSGQTENIALRSSLRSYQRSKMVKGKIFKTLGGFVAVILTIKPVDKFIDKIIFGKIINPSMEKFENIDFETFSQKLQEMISQDKIQETEENLKKDS